MLLGNSQKEETNKAIIRRLYSLLFFFFTLFTALYMKGRYIIMKNLKQTVKDVKDNKKGLILFGGLFVVGVVATAVGMKVGNSIIKK